MYISGSFWISAINSVILCTSPCTQDVVALDSYAFSTPPAFRWNSIVDRWKRNMHKIQHIFFDMVDFWAWLMDSQSGLFYLWTAGFPCEQSMFLPGQSLRRPARPRRRRPSPRRSWLTEEKRLVLDEQWGYHTHLLPIHQPFTYPGTTQCTLPSKT